MNIIEDKRLNGEGDKTQHGFFGRQGGVSEGIYASLNCGSGSNDAARHVQENRARVAKYFDQTPENLMSVWQVHSKECIYINVVGQFSGERPKADAMVTDQVGLVLGILTADCGPVLFAGEKSDGSPVIGAAHAGWGGALKGITDSTIEMMMERGTVLETIRAAVGPCIGPKSYEVSLGFEDPFLKRDPEDERFFREAQKAGHLMFDLPGYIANRLAQAGLRQVTITGQDTCAMKDAYFSYRRKTHAGEPDYGRQISAIMIKGG